MSHSFKDAIYFYTVDVAQNVLTANLACEESTEPKLRYLPSFKYSWSVCSFESELKRLFLARSAYHADICSHTWVLTIFSLHFYPLFHSQRQSGGLISISL